MKNSILLLTVISITFMMACKNEKKMNNNPFLTEYSTPFQVPPFDQIDTTHFLPAFIEGIAQHDKEVSAIAENTDEPTFENTILPFDKSGKMLRRVNKVFFNLTEANTNDQLQSIAEKVSPLLSKHSDDISMNPKLFARIKTVYNNRNASKLDAQQIRAVEKYYRDFERQGANLPKEQQDQLRKINEDLSMLSLTFGNNLLAETNKNFKLVIDNKADLDGLPDDVVSAAAETAEKDGNKGKWQFTLAKPSLIPFLQYAQNRELREKIYRGYFMRGNNGNANDNKKVLSQIYHESRKVFYL